MASRYGLLPSEVMNRATTFDLQVLDISAKWERHQRERAETGGKPPIPQLSQEQMLEMIRKTREQHAKT